MLRRSACRHRRITLAIALLAFTAFEGRAQSDRLEKVVFDEANLDDIIEFFRKRGSAGKPRNILVDPKLDRDMSVTLTLHDVTKGVAFAYVAEIAGFGYREEKHALRIFPRKGSAPAAPAFLRRGGPATWQRATEIQMPKVEFEETELSQVISDLSSASRKLDPKKKGLNILLSRGVDPSTPVTLELSDVPVSAVLKYVAELAGLKMRADGAAIVFMAKPKPPKEKEGG